MSLELVKEADESGLEFESARLRKLAEFIQIENDADLEKAGQLVETIKAHIAAIGEKYDGPVEEADRAHKALTKERGLYLTPAKETKKVVQDKSDLYCAARRRREEDAAKAAAARAAAEAQDEHLARAVDAEEKGDIAGADAILDAPPQDAAPIAPTGGKHVFGSGYSNVDYDYEIVDANLIPRNFMKIDEVAIKKVVKAMKEKTDIPGVRVFPVDKAVFRSK